MIFSLLADFKVIFVKNLITITGVQGHPALEASEKFNLIKNFKLKIFIVIANFIFENCFAF